MEEQGLLREAVLLATAIEVVKEAINISLPEDAKVDTSKVGLDEGILVTLLRTARAQ